jgi:hypothetical protein
LDVGLALEAGVLVDADLAVDAGAGLEEDALGDAAGLDAGFAA